MVAPSTEGVICLLIRWLVLAMMPIAASKHAVPMSQKYVLVCCALPTLHLSLRESLIFFVLFPNHICTYKYTAFTNTLHGDK